MKRTLNLAAVLLLIAGLLCGCGLPRRMAPSASPPAEVSPAATGTPAPSGTPQPTGTPPAIDAGIAVTSIDELIDAVAPGVTLLIPESGLLVTPEDFTFRDSGNDYVRLDWAVYNYTVVIQNVDGLTIRGQGPRPAPLTGSASDYYVLYFENCTNLTIENVSAGHLAESNCEGGVFHLDDCRGVTLRSVEMYGCGTEGLYLEDVVGLTVADSVIYDCSARLMTVEDCRDLTFTNTVFRDSGFYTLVDVNNSNQILFDGCQFNDNRSEEFYSVFTVGGRSSGIAVRNCQFTGNTPSRLSDSEAVTFRDCEFQDNGFEGNGYFNVNNAWVTGETDYDLGDWSPDVSAIVARLAGQWVCTDVVMAGLEPEKPEMLGVMTWITLNGDGTLAFYYDSPEGELTAYSSYLVNDEVNRWDDGTVTDWCAIFHSDDGKYLFKILLYQEFLQIYAYEDWDTERGWGMMLVYKYGES